MKKITLTAIILVALTLFSSCGKKYEIAPGEQMDFERLGNGAKVISAEIEGEIDGKTVIQPPAAFFFKESRGTEEE